MVDAIQSLWIEANNVFRELNIRATHYDALPLAASETWTHEEIDPSSWRRNPIYFKLRNFNVPSCKLP